MERLVVRVSAVYALPWDVIEVKEPILVKDREGLIDALTTGYYVIVGQLGERLVLVRAGENEEGDIIASGEPFVIWAQLLETEEIGITYLKAKRWTRSETGSR